MRHFLTLAHRYLGLAAAAFLFITGVTGAMISWDHEIDAFLNPHLMQAPTTGRALPPLELVRLTEQRHPHVQVSAIPIAVEEGRSVALSVSPGVDPDTGQLHQADFNQVFLDPVTGAELGTRERGAVWPITRETFVSFVYKLHYSLHLPEMWGIDRWGIWLLGIVAIGWTLDCFIGLYLTLPARIRRPVGGDVPARRTMASFWQRWAPAWKVRWSGGSAKLNFDLHRAFSLWTWLVLLILAFTAFSLNLYREVFHPVMSAVSTVTPTPFDLRKPRSRHQPIEARVGWEQVIELSRAEGARRGWVPLGGVSYANRYGIYQARFFEPGQDHGAGGMGPIRLYIDALDGRILGERVPGTGTAADIFVQAQFPLHSGRILGLPGRILVSAMGVVVAMLSVTGVVIWWRKRRARVATAARRIPATSPVGPQPEGG